jgi:hypothetical protein
VRMIQKGREKALPAIRRKGREMQRRIYVRLASGR